MSIVTTIRCDHCGRVIPGAQTAKSLVTIDQRQYDLCEVCRNELLGPLAGKGRPVPPTITLTPSQPAPWTPSPTVTPATPMWPGTGTGTYPGPNTPTITWQAGQPLYGSSGVLSPNDAVSYTAYSARN